MRGNTLKLCQGRYGHIQPLFFFCCEFLIIAPASLGEAALVRVLVVQIYFCWSPVVLCAIKSKIGESSTGKFRLSNFSGSIKASVSVATDGAGGCQPSSITDPGTSQGQSFVIPALVVGTALLLLTENEFIDSSARIDWSPALPRAGVLLFVNKEMLGVGTWSSAEICLIGCPGQLANSQVQS